MHGGEIELLMDVIAKNDEQTLREALEEKPELVHQKGGTLGWSLLHQAAYHGRETMVAMLLDKGADVRSRDKGDFATPLHWAAGAGHLHVVTQLVVAGSDVNAIDDHFGSGPLGWATVPGFHARVAEFLVDAGAEILLFPAIALNRADIVRERVEADAAELASTLGPFTAYGRPLHFAAKRGRARIAALLVDLGADPNERDWIGLTPLAVAAFHGRSDVVTKLEARGARLDFGAALALEDHDAARRLHAEDPSRIREGGVYAPLLCYAAQEGHLEAVRFLVEECGAPVDDPREWWPGHRVAPLHLAASRGHLDVVRFFTHAGADLLIEDSRYKSAPRGWAIEHRQSEVVEFLREREPEI